MRLKVINMKNLFMIIVIIVLSIGSLYAGDTRYNENMHTPQGIGGGTNISPQTGTLSLSFTDVALPGMNNLHFEVTRTYSSTLANIYNMAMTDDWKSKTTTHTPEDWKYGLGSGWTFSWPFIFRDIDDTSPIQKLNLFWQGSVYELDQSFSSDKDENNIKYYYVNDKRVYLDSSVVYEEDYTDDIAGPLNNLNVRSRYCLELKSGRKYYFSEAGNLMLIRNPSDPGDIKKPEIWFYYKDHQLVSNPDDYEEYRDECKVELVVDTIGRVIDFIYKTDDENWLEEIRYSVTVRGEEESRGVTYLHEKAGDYEVMKIDGTNKTVEVLPEGLPQDDLKYVLSGYENQMGHLSKYSYSVYEAPFSFYPDHGNGKNYYALLEKIHSIYTNDGEDEKYKSCQMYEYNQPQGNYTEYAKNFVQGFMNIFKVTRYYLLNRRGELFQNTTYGYYGRMYGKEMNEYWTIEKKGGLENKYVYGASNLDTEDNLLKYTESEGNDGDFLERIDYVYDVRKTLKEKNMYRSGLLKYTEEYIYDKWNDLINHKAPNGLVTETRYDEKFHIPVYSIQRDVKNGDGSVFDVEKESEIRESDGKVLKERMRAHVGTEEKWITSKEYTYDQYGNITAITDALGYRTTMKYDVYHIFPEEVSMEVTLDGDLTQVKGFKLFNTDGSVWIEADNNGYAVEHIYDVLGTEIKIIPPDEDDVRVIQNASEFLDEPWRLSRENNGYMEMMINYQEEEVITYGEEFNGKRMKTGKYADGLGHLEKVVIFESADSDVVYSEKTMVYDSQENMIAITDPDRGEDFINRRVMGKVVQVYDKTWLVWYDDLNRKKKVEYPDEGSKVVKKEVEYNDRDLIVTTTNTKGYQTIEYYDIDGNLTKIINPGVKDESGSIRDVIYEFEYNQINRQTGFKDPMGESVQYIYDERGLLLEQDYGNGKDVMSYNETGNIVEKTDRNMNSIRFEYDEMGRNIKQEYYTKEDSVTPYDIKELGYDGRGNIVKVKSTELVENMEYDSRKRIKKIERTYCDPVLREDMMNNLDWITTSDEAGQIFTFTFTYTPNDLVETMTLPNGKVLHYQYDEDKLQLSGIETEVNGGLQGIVNNLEYNRSGQVVGMNYGNNTEQGWEFDARKRIKRTWTDNSTGNIFSLQYTIDTENNIEKINDNFFEYDSINRLIKSDIVRLGETDFRVKVKDAFGTSLEEPVTGGKEYNEDADLNSDGYVNGYDHIKACQDWIEKYDREVFEYDINGNRRKLIQNGKEYTYYYGERNRLTRIERDSTIIVRYEYDNNGNIVKKLERNEDQTWTEFDFVYDIHNRLLKTYKDGIQHTRYIYDNGGLRMYKEEQGYRTYYFRNGATVNYEVEMKEVNVKESSYIISGELIAGRITRENAGEETVCYYHLDHLNSTKAVTDENGELVLMYEYRAFGTELDRVGTDENRYSYIGREFDDEINLYYVNARYYDATIGRFINVDPAQAGTNWYVYCRNNPLSSSDPTGLYDETTTFDPDLLKQYGSLKIVNINKDQSNTDDRHYVFIYYDSNNNDDMTHVRRRQIQAYALLRRDEMKAAERSGTPDTYTAADAMADVADYAAGFDQSTTEYVNDLALVLAARQERRSGLMPDQVRDDTYSFGFAWRDSGFKPQFQDGGNQVQHFIGYLLGGWYGGIFVKSTGDYRNDTLADRLLADVAIDAAYHIAGPYNKGKLGDFIRDNVRD